VFSDKTGTLTENIMESKKDHVHGSVIFFLKFLQEFFSGVFYGRFSQKALSKKDKIFMGPQFFFLEFFPGVLFRRFW
jgi:magnesium-transporting ATPase (P-type)